MSKVVEFLRLSDRGTPLKREVCRWDVLLIDRAGNMHSFILSSVSLKRLYYVYNEKGLHEVKSLAAMSGLHQSGQLFSPSV